MTTGGRLRAFAATVGACVVALAVPVGAVLAQEPQVKLALLTVDQPGPYFDVTMRPGDRRTLTVELADTSPVASLARTYAADVYTIVNGGFGGRLRGEPQTSMTAWLDYPDAALTFKPGERLRRAFTVDVPDDAVPGEYITSIVLERDAPRDDGGSVVLDEVVRQAVAVVLTVPGPRLPQLTIGAATHRDVAGRSIVSIAVANPGNIRLKPTVEFTLVNEAGVQVSEATVQMDSFYAWTDTSIEVPLAARLLPGSYTIRLSLRDEASGATAEDLAIPLTVDAANANGGPDGEGAQLTPVDQGSGIGAMPLSLPVVLVGGALLVLLVCGAVAVARSRRHRPITRD